MEIRSYAKVNLSLDIMGLRADGYHEIATVMHKTSLYDELTIDYIDGSDFKIEITSNKRYVPNDERNLAFKAVQLMNTWGHKTGTVKIHIEKKIPVSAGLAGGSGNAAAVIIALNKMWHLGFSTKELCHLGHRLGADVPFLILVQNSSFRCALGTGTGEVLTPIRESLKKEMVIAKPKFGVSTKEVYQGIDDCDIYDHPNTEELIKGIKEDDFNLVSKNMVNVLENYTLNKYEDVAILKKIMIEEGSALKVLMSGSGPSVMGIYDDKEKARNVALKLREKGYEAYWLKTYTQGRKND